jgi:hypothetical protein
MIDPTPPDTQKEPITVNANPLVDQREAGLRQALLAFGAIMAALGFAKLSGIMSILANEAGPILTVVGFIVSTVAVIYGQWKTRVASQKAAQMAGHLDDSIAKVK